MAAGVELLMDGNLISLACHLVVPLCERGTIVWHVLPKKIAFVLCNRGVCLLSMLSS